MEKLKVKNLIVFLCLIFTAQSAFSIDMSEYGDFSSRSVIVNTLENNGGLDEKVKEELNSRKLVPSVQCLFAQIKKGNLENVELLLKAKVNPNQSYLGDYPIYTAALENQFEILKLLLENNAKLDRGFFSELYAAVKNKNSQMAKYLIDKGAKVNYTDSISTHTILYLSLKNKMYDISSELIAKGAKPDLQSVKYIQKHKLENLVIGK